MRLPCFRSSSLPFIVACTVALSLASGCATSQPAASDIDPRLLGSWKTDMGATYTISAPNGSYDLWVVDYDGEVFEVQSVEWTDGVLSWTYFVPSSGHSVSEETVTFTQDRIDLRWTNTADESGLDVLLRAP